jgi:hypothetical protein
LDLDSKNAKSKRNVVIEWPCIVEWHSKPHFKIKQNSDLKGDKTSYLDEMWIDNNLFKKYWQIDNINRVLKDHSAGNRLILNDVTHAQPIYKAGPVNSKYHGQINRCNFDRYVPE